MFMAGKSKKLDSESVELLRSAYANGYGLHWISKQLGVSVATVRYHLSRAGVVFRPVGRPRVREEANGPGEKSIGG